MPISRTFPLLALALLALAAYGALFYLWRMNVPYHDDYSDILRFLWQFEQAGSAGERLHSLLEPQGNHRTAASRLLYLALFRLQGEMDFVALSALANLALPLLCLLYSLVLFKSGSRALPLAVAALVIFSPRAYTLLHWPMTAFHFYYLMLYGALVVVCLGRRECWALLLALALAAAASFTSAGGQAVWIVGALYLLWQSLVKSPRYGALALWCLCAMVLVNVIYISEPLASPFPLVDEAGPLHLLHFTIVLLGSCLGFGSTVYAALAGAGLCFAFALLLVRDWRSGLHGGHFYLLLLFVVAAAIALGRSDYVPVDYALTPRYSFASTHVLACLGLLWLAGGRALTRAETAGLVLLALVLCVATYHYYGPRYEALMNSRVQAFNKQRYRVPFRDETEMRDWVEAAVEDGLYHPPARPLPKHFVFTDPKAHGS